MTIDTNFTLAGLFGSTQTVAVDNHIKDGFFAGYLEEQMARAKSAFLGREKQQYEENSDDMALIKEKGLVAYIMEHHARRIREEILESMGLTEEALGKMPPEQRAAIEKRIAEETRKRMAAEALMQKGNDKSPDTHKLEEIMMGLRSGTGLFAAGQEDEQR